MMADIINWVGKELKVISGTELFNSYFEYVELTKGEDTFYLTNKLEGIEVIMSSNLTIDTIHLFSENYQNNRMFSGEMPFNIKFSFRREDIRQIFGDPKKSGGGHKALHLGYVPFWDKYFFQNYSLHFRYSDNNDSIVMITIASLELEKYFDSTLQ